MAIEHALHRHVCKFFLVVVVGCKSALQPNEAMGSPISQIIHLICSGSSFLSWLLFVGDLAMIGFLSMRAYRDGRAAPPSPSSLSCRPGFAVITRADIGHPPTVDTLDHFEVPIFGRLANSFVDDE